MIMIKSAALIYRYADFSQFRLRIFTITRALSLCPNQAAQKLTHSAQIYQYECADLPSREFPQVSLRRFTTHSAQIYQYTKITCAYLPLRVR